VVQGTTTDWGPGSGSRFDVKHYDGANVTTTTTTTTVTATTTATTVTSPILPSPPLPKLKEGDIYCVGCGLPLDPSKHLKRVYGEWDFTADYYRYLLNGYDRRYSSSFRERSVAAGHTKGCILAHVYHTYQTLLDQTVTPHHMEFFKRVYRDTDLPIQANPSFECLEEYNSPGIGLTRQQFELLQTKYPFLHLDIRRGDEFVEHMPDEQYAFQIGDASVIRNLHLHQLPLSILRRLVRPQNVISGVEMDGKRDPKNPLPPEPLKQLDDYTDIGGDPDQDSDAELDIHEPHPELDSDRDDDVRVASMGGRKAKTDKVQVRSGTTASSVDTSQPPPTAPAADVDGDVPMVPAASNKQ